MPTMKLPFGPWLPDLGPTENSGVLDAFNVFPGVNGYLPVRNTTAQSSLTAATTITASQVQGAVSYLDTSASPFVFVSTDRKIWGIPLSLGSVATDLTNPSISAVVSNGFRTFAKYNDLVIATDRAIVPQKSTLSSGAASQFTALGGTPPTAMFVAVVRDFVVFANTTTDNRQLVWSALGNAQDYVASATTQSDSQILQDEGPIIGLVGGEYMLIFFRFAVYRGTYIGSPVIWQFDKILSNVEIMGSIVTNTPLRMGYLQLRMGDAVFFLTTTGLAVIQSGQLYRHLSKNRNGNYFVRTAQNGTRTDIRQMLAADAGHNRVAWGYKTAVGGGHTIENVVIYDIDLDRFSRISVNTTFIVSGNGYGANPFYPSNLIYITHDTGLLTVHGTLATAILPAFIETADIEHIPGQRAFVNSVRPVVNHQGTTGAPMVMVGTKAKHQQSISYSTTVTVNSNGETPQRASGRLHRYQCIMSISASWSYMTGLEIDFQPDGER